MKKSHRVKDKDLCRISDTNNRLFIGVIRRIYSTHQRDDDLAVRVRLEFVAWITTSSQFNVIVDLAIDGENLLPVFAKERLCAGIWTRKSSIKTMSNADRIKLTNADDCKTLMDKNGALTNVTSGPVGTTVTLSLGKSNKSGPVSGGVWEAMDGKYATHFCL